MGARRASEADFAQRWAAGEWRGWLLCSEQGEQYRLIFQGRHGGPVGPDFRDAVLEDAAGVRISGDVELHLRPSGWYAHAHATDPRYNDVALHVTLSAGPRRILAVPLASGRMAPQVTLERAAPPLDKAPSWPCEQFSAHIGQATVRSILLDSGWARFGRHVEAFEARLIEAGCARREKGGRNEAAARVLTVALAEGLAYGHDRVLLRSIGERLAMGENPAALRSAGAAWPCVEHKRLEGLLALWDRWGACGPWNLLDALTGASSSRDASRKLIEALVVRPGLVSPGRAAILVANVVAPFAAAWAAFTGDVALGTSARAAYSALPGLPSNQITREMKRQVGLPKLPTGAVAQQGLQHLWSEHCRDKQCAGCPCNVCNVALHATNERPLPARESGRSFR